VGNKPLEARGNESFQRRQERKGPEMETVSTGGKSSENRKPISAVFWKTGTGQITDKPARGMNPEVRNVA
jgi:hypothetical protein